MTRARTARRTPAYVYVLLTLVLVGSVFPLYWMFVVASNDSSAVTKLPPAVVPGSNLFALAQKVSEQVPFGESLVNTAIVAGITAAGQVLFCSLAGFAFAKLRFLGRNVLLVMVVATMLLPTQLGVVPLYLLMTRLDWVDTKQALIVPFIVGAFGVFWMRQHIAGAVHDEVLEAARVDGASTFRIYRSVVFPMIRPATLVLGLFSFMTAWNDFFWPLIVIQSPENYTVQVAIQQLRANYFVDYGLTMNGAFLATLPMLLLFFLVGRRLVAGVMEGAVKG